MAAVAAAAAAAVAAVARRLKIQRVVRPMAEKKIERFCCFGHVEIFVCFGVFLLVFETFLSATCDRIFFSKTFQSNVA